MRQLRPPGAIRTYAILVDVAGCTRRGAARGYVMLKRCAADFWLDSRGWFWPGCWSGDGDKSVKNFSAIGATASETNRRNLQVRKDFTTNANESSVSRVSQCVVSRAGKIRLGEGLRQLGLCWRVRKRQKKDGNSQGLEPHS
jgi:hypothetical protein